MTRGIIKYIFYAIGMTILYLTITFLHNRDNTSKDPNQTNLNYIIKPPSALSYVYTACFLLGMVLFIVFFILYLRQIPSVTKGHLWFALIFAGIGLLIVIYASQWRISVNGSNMEIHRLLHNTQTISVTDISKAEVGDKQQITLYDTSGKKLIVVDRLSDNYTRFYNTLGNNGKLN